ncbi:hypothetical protein ACVWXM_007026 [Bradyrhizobium sp. GM7.3]|jgi:hypothetical protein
MGRDPAGAAMAQPAGPGQMAQDLGKDGLVVPEEQAVGCGARSCGRERGFTPPRTPLAVRYPE